MPDLILVALVDANKSSLIGSAFALPNKRIWRLPRQRLRSFGERTHLRVPCSAPPPNTVPLYLSPLGSLHHTAYSYPLNVAITSHARTSGCRQKADIWCKDHLWSAGACSRFSARLTFEPAFQIPNRRAIFSKKLPAVILY